MAKNAKLRDALNQHKGVDHKLDRQKKLQKDARKRKRAREEPADDEDVTAENAEALKPLGEIEAVTNGKAKRQKKQQVVEEQPEAEEEEDDSGSEGWETADEDNIKTMVDLSRLQDSDFSDSDSEGDEDERENLQAVTGADDEDDDEEDDDEDEDEDIALSDIDSLASEEKGDIIPHQRLTIYNNAALTRAHKSIALPSTLPFSSTQSVVSAEPTVIEDIDDDLKRELSFYKQSLDAVTRARQLLKAEGIPFARPSDYFAEMVKSDEHMGKIKKKLVDDAASKKAASEARRQRDLKKFGKQVQVAKLQEREKEKRTTLDRIKMLKKKRSGAPIGNEQEDDMFDVALEDAAVTQKKDKEARRAGGGAGANHKRQKKNEKFGFGGKKRFSKSNDAESSADTRSFSTKRMKGGKGKPQRPGKSRRAARG